jgi:hypothetical protein
MVLIRHLSVAMKIGLALSTIITLTIVTAAVPLEAQTKQNPVVGQAAFADWTQERPGILRKISVADLPEPKPAESVRKQRHLVPRPENAWPIAPPGFKVNRTAHVPSGESPRTIPYSIPSSPFSAVRFVWE